MAKYTKIITLRKLTLSDCKLLESLKESLSIFTASKVLLHCLRRYQLQVDEICALTNRVRQLEYQLTEIRCALEDRAAAENRLGDLMEND